MDAVETRKRTQRQSQSQLNIISPLEKASGFFNRLHDCSDDCKSEFKIWMQYSKNDVKTIEIGPKGQSENCDWFKMRKGLLTSSKFKDIVHSTNRERTAEVLLQDQNFDEDNLPAPIAYGKKNESKARNVYIKCHRYRHRACNVDVPGLMVSSDNQHLAASPDGVVTCKYCGKYLVEIKCLWSFRNFRPKTALTMSKLCTKDSEGNTCIDKKT